MNIDFKAFDLFLRDLLLDSSAQSNERFTDFIQALINTKDWFDEYLDRQDTRKYAVQPVLSAKTDPRRFEKTAYLMGQVTNVWGHCKTPGIVYRSTVVKNPYAIGRIVLFKHPLRPFSSWTMVDLTKQPAWIQGLRSERNGDYILNGMWDTVIETDSRGHVIWTPDSQKVAQALSKYVFTLWNSAKKDLSFENKALRGQLLFKLKSIAYSLRGLSVAPKSKEQEVVLYHPKGIRVTVLGRERINQDEDD